MDKKYTIIFTENDNRLNIKRENNGFNIFEMIGLVESIRADLITQSKSMVTKNAVVERIVRNKNGDVKIDVGEDKVELTDI